MSAILPINLNAILPNISLWLFSSFRISSFFMVAPLFSQVSIPNTIKIILTFSIAFLVAPNLLNTTKITPNLLSAHGLIVLLQEVLVGFAMGFIVKITFEVLNLAGQIIGISMQLNFDQLYNPVDNTKSNVIGLFYQVFGMLIFITMHGPLILLSMVYRSFIAMPLGGGFISFGQIQSVLNFSSSMFVFSLLLSLPVIITLLVINIGEMVIARVATSFNIFTVGFFVSISVGLITLIFCLPPSLRDFEEILQHTFRFILNWQLIR